MKYIQKYWAWVAIFFAVLIVVYAVISMRNYRPPSEFTMATGREGGAYHKYGLEYQRLLAEQGYTLHLVPTAGSKENLQLLRDGSVDVALVQTSTASEEDEAALSSLASLFYEPLWIFYRVEEGGEPVEVIADFKDRAIAVGEEGGGTHDIALFILGENGVTDENATFYPLQNADAVQSILDGSVDVVFMIASPEAEPVMDLLTAPGIDVLNIERVLAYQSRYNDITTVTLGEGAIDLALNIPQEDKALLTAVAAFVAPQDLSPDLARLLLTVAEEVHGAGGILETRGEFPSTKLVEIPMDVTAEGYLERGPTGLDRFFPLWVASQLERLLFVLVPFLILLYPLFRATPLAVGFFFRFRIYRWYRRLRQIELGVDTMSIEKLDEQILWLEDLEQDLAKRLAVPIMYLADVYLLRFQVNQVERRLERRRAVLLSGGTSEDAASADPEGGEEPHMESAFPDDLFNEDSQFEDRAGDAAT